MVWTAGELFHILGPQTENVRLPNWACVHLTTAALVYDALSWYCWESTLNTTRSVRCNGYRSCRMCASASRSWRWCGCIMSKHYRKSQWFSHLLFHRHDISTQRLTNSDKALKEITKLLNKSNLKWHIKNYCICGDPSNTDCTVYRQEYTMTTNTDIVYKTHTLLRSSSHLSGTSAVLLCSTTSSFSIC